MATNKKSSTSKTARVMNLLSKSRDDAPVEQTSVASPEVQEQAVQPAPTAEAAPAPAPAPAHTTPLISSMQADSAISNQVMSALESALDNELSAAQEETEPTPVAPVEPEAPVEAESAVEEAEEEAVVEAEEEVIEEAVVEAEEEVIEEPVVEAESEITTPAAEVVPAVTAAPAAQNAEPAPPTRFQIDADTTYVNVMETLVEEKANKYIDLFGLCKCPRCVADVKAYALNHLNPKYVVMRTGEVIPRITVYENQFSAVVTAQILNACKIVMSSPRHDQL